MSTAAPLQSTAAKSSLVSKASHAGLLLQRKCASGGPASLTGECEECNSKRLQKKLSIGASNDPLEQEADRVADQVLAAPAHSAVSRTQPRIQRFTGHSSGQTDTAPASVDRVLAGSGKPLDPALQQDMGQRFGHDFSRVRVHSGPAAEQSAREVNAHAYTVGHNIVFGAGQFAPGTHMGRRLLAHELTHVVQQSGAEELRVRQQQRVYELSPTIATASPVLRRGLDPRAQEADRAASEMWGVINDISSLGAEVEFTYYTSNGAMTLVSYKQNNPGISSAASVSLDKFKQDSLGFKGGIAAGSTLVTFIGTTERYFKLTLKREAAKWSLVAWGEENNKSLPTMPPEGRSQPNVSSAGWPAEIFIRVQKEVAKWIPVLKTYPQGTAILNLSAEFDDNRLTALNMISQSNSGGKGSVFAPAATSTEMILINTILAFSQGLGKRTIKFKLEGKAPAGETMWRVSEASTDRGPPPPLPDEASVIVADYHRMHAEIIRKWREGVKDAAVYAGMLGAEQLAFWLIGGVLAKGLGAIFELAAPRLIGFIRLGSKSSSRAGIEYLETMVARLPIAEREEMQVLARKMETEGVEALGQAEKKSLERLLKKLEGLIDAPLSQAEKDTLRGRMATRFAGAKPGVDALFQSAKRSYQIHHRMPLEWAHKFPGFDANAGKNLIGLETEVHKGVNAVWTRLRNTASASKVDGNVVSKVMGIVDKNFRKWYDVVPSSSGAALEAEVLAAKGAALDEVTALVNTL